MEPLPFTLIASLNILLTLILGRIRPQRGCLPLVMGILSLVVLDLSSALIILVGGSLSYLRLSLIVSASAFFLFLSGFGNGPQKWLYAILAGIALLFTLIGVFAPTAPGAFAISLFLPLMNIIGGLSKRPAFSSKPVGKKPVFISLEDSNSELLIILSLLVVAVSSAAPPWAGIASLALSIAVFVLLAVRIHSGSIITVISPHEGQEERSLPPERPRPPKEPEATNVGKELFDRCCKYMDDKKPYLVESFSMQDLARAMFTNVVYMSRTINSITGANFKRFVNSYRVSYAKGLFMKDPNISLTDLYHLSGFANSATFNNAFKAICDESPSSWCRRERLRLLRKKAEK